MSSRRLATIVTLVVAGCATELPIADPAYFGAAVRPPGGLDQIRRGMPVAEVRRLLPQAAEVKDGLRVPSGARDVALVILTRAADDGEPPVVATITANLDGRRGLALLTAAWGAPSAEPGDDPSRPVWRDERTGWRAELHCDSSCDVAFVRYKPLAAFVAGAAVQPPPEHACLRIGMSPSEASAACGIAFRDLEPIDVDYDGVELYPRFGTLRLVELDYYLPARARAMFVERWGPGRPTPESTDAEVSWVDPATRWRATLGSSTAHGSGTVVLTLVEYVPFIELFDQLAARSLLGSSVASIRARYPALFWVYDPKLAFITLPPSDLDLPRSSGTNVLLIERDGVVVELSIGCFDSQLFPGGREAILAALERRWGKPRRDNPDGSLHIPYRHYGDHVTVYENEHGLGVRID